MPLLQVRDFPAELYDVLARVAHAENRSIPQQTIVLLKKALSISQEQKVRRQAVLKEIEDFKINNANSFPDPVDLIREDRDR